MISFRELQAADIRPDMLADFDRSQQITHCLKKVDGELVPVPRAFVDDWTEEEKAFVIWALGDILARGGYGAGAFAGDSLRGLIAVDSSPLGNRGQYREVSGFWVSRESRGKGIGRCLFSMAKKAALAMGGEKLYISSHPAVETQAFYAAMGCVEAEEYSPAHVAREPDACQIECTLLRD